MINNFKIDGFKKFKNCELRLAPLTVLAGINGGGKSSVIQSLLLIREAILNLNTVVHLNGPYDLELGTYADIQNWADAEAIDFEITDAAGKVFKWTFDGTPNSLYIDVRNHPTDPPAPFRPIGRTFQYLSAERFGPRGSLKSSALPPSQLNVGSHGEFCGQVIDTLGGIQIAMERSSQEMSSGSPLLKFETEGWLSKIVRPIQIDVESLATKTATAIRYRTVDGEWVRPPNMGFGISYTLPIILAGLILEKGGILIVENPEAHLHPAGQSQMGIFLSRIASAGVQVILETHSDHILNGIRLAIGSEKSLEAKDAVVHYFGIDDIDPLELNFTELGGINSWPKGFFDQYQLDVATLTRLRRAR